MNDDNSDIANELRFLRDSSDVRDFFGAHSKLGRAVAQAIRTNPETKVIGLLGAWGSGKSTVVEQIRRQLRKPRFVPKFKVFIYDAWLHQSEPPRLSFLDRFLEFAESEGLTTRAEWETQRREVNGEIEAKETNTRLHLSFSGWLLLLSIFLFPVGIKLTGNSYINDMVAGWGGSQLDPTLAVTTGFLFAPFVILLISLVLYLTGMTESNAAELVSLFVNKTPPRQATTVMKSPDPTATEFQCLFSEIVTLIGNTGLRFIIVIDNLDRLPPEEAMAMWTAVRSFFLGKPPKIGAPPIIVLPLDTLAVAKMFKADNTEQSKLQLKAFMDKTFDLTFRVPPPVVSDWKRYFHDRMKHVFGAKLDPKRIYEVGFMIERTHDFGAVITPRSLNVLINAIGTLWLQRRRGGVTFTSVAFYTVFSDEINEGRLLDFLAKPVLDIDNFDPNWRKAVAALHYGVKLDKGLQILIQDQLGAAIQQSSVDAFAKLAQTPGFDDAFRDLLRTAPEFQESSTIFNSATLLANLNLKDAVWVGHCWALLRDLFLKAGTFNLSSKQSSDSLGLLARSGTLEDQKAFQFSATKKLAERAQFLMSTFEDTKAFLAAVESLFAASQISGATLPQIDLTGLTEPYVNLIALAEGRFELQQMFLNTSDGDIADHIRKNFGTEMLVPLEQKLNALLLLKPNLPWISIVPLAENVISTRGAADISMAPALLLIGIIGGRDVHVAEMAKSLVRNQTISNVIQGEIVARDALIRAIALTIQHGPPFHLQRNWNQFLETNPGNAPEILAALRRFGADVGLDRLVDIAQNEPQFTTVAQAMADFGFTTGELNIQDGVFISQSLETFFSILSPQHHPQALSALVKSPNFENDFRGRAIDPVVERLCAIALSTLAMEEWRDLRTYILEEIERKFGLMNTDQWVNEIINNGQLLNLAHRVSDGLRRPIFNRGSSLYTALDQMVSTVLNTMDQSIHMKWFQALRLLPLKANQELVNNVWKQVPHISSEQLVALISAGGRPFLVNELQAPADGATSAIIIRLLDTTETAKRLNDFIDIYKGWVAESGLVSRRKLKSRFIELVDQVGDADKIMLRELAKSLGFPRW